MQNKIITQRPHPGPLFKSDIIKARKLTAKQVAEYFQIKNANYLYIIIAGKQALNLQMCARLEVVFGEDAEKWATRQLQYDIDRVTKSKSRPNIDFFLPKNAPRVHPGTLFREKVMTPNNLTLKTAGESLGIHETHVSQILAGEASITLEKCLKLEELFGENAEYWATLQMRYDLDHKREEVAKEGLQPWRPDKGPK